MERLTLVPGGPDARPFRAGEAIFPEVRLEGRPYLRQASLFTALYREGRKVAEEEKPVGFPPLTVALLEVAPPVVPEARGGTASGSATPRPGRSWTWRWGRRASPAGSSPWASGAGPLG